MRTISDHDGVILLQEVFELTPPVSFETLKKVYRSLSKERHPDMSTGSDENFKILNDAFGKLSDLYTKRSYIFNVSDEPNEDGILMPSKTSDGTPLTDLGKGVGFRENGVPCDDCKGKGYNLESITRRKTVVCPSCNGGKWEPRTYTCKACAGSGKFTQARSKRVVDCRRCNGSGKFKHPHQTQRCGTCWGHGKVEKSSTTKSYRAFKCYECRGRGEVAIDNPVIPNGVML